MTDIIERLRGWTPNHGYTGTRDCVADAAAEIERLRKLDAQFGRVESWIALHTDFTRPPYEAEKGAEGLIAALDRLKARVS